MRPALLLALLLTSAARGRGPVARTAPMLRELLPAGALPAKVGEWVTYRLDGGAGRASYWRIAVVGQERDKRDREALWIEMEIGEQPELVAPLAQLRLLVARESGMSADGVSRLLVAQGFERPRELSPEAISAIFAAPPAEAGEPGPSAGFRIRTGAPVRLRTPAGEVQARPVELLLGGTVLQRLWMSRAVPVLGLAKLELPALGQSMEVVDHGIDARPRMALPAPEAPQIRLDRYNADRPSPAPAPGGP